MSDIGAVDRRRRVPAPPTVLLLGILVVAALVDLLAVWSVAYGWCSEPVGSVAGLAAAFASAGACVRAAGGRLACLLPAAIAFCCLLTAPGVADREGVAAGSWVASIGFAVALASSAVALRFERSRSGPLTVLWFGPRADRRRRRLQDGRRGLGLRGRWSPPERRVPEVGALVESHRPLPAPAGWAILLAISSPFPVWFAVGPPGPWVGLAMFVAFLGCFGYGLGEWLLLEHRLHEHALVFRSSLPGLKTFVVPLYTIDPDDLEVGGRRLHDGGVVAALDRRFRQCPLVGTTIRFDAVDPDRAHGLAVGRFGWIDAGAPTIGIRGDTRRGLAPRVRWMVSYRRPQEHLEAIRAAVVASRATLPPEVARVVDVHRARPPASGPEVEPDRRGRPLGPDWLP